MFAKIRREVRYANAPMLVALAPPQRRSRLQHAVRHVRLGAFQLVSRRRWNREDREGYRRGFAGSDGGQQMSAVRLEALPLTKMHFRVEPLARQVAQIAIECHRPIIGGYCLV